ncbi:Transcription factor TFIIIB component B [Tulasnella sp. UAMH 9824]|nr:Transcription factor TFIIIB component B [Tulasnella sp. UAMH 9824]
MYTSSRVEKGGSQYKPLVKPRQPRASTNHPTQADATSQNHRTDGSSNATPRLSPETSYVEPFPPSIGEPQDLPETSSGSLIVGPLGEGHTALPSVSPTIRPTPRLPGAGTQVTSLNSGVTPITLARPTTIVPTRGIAIVPTRGQTVSSSTGGNAIVPTRTSIVPTRGGTTEAGAQAPSGITTTTPSRGAPIVPMRGTSIVPTPAVASAPSAAAVPIVPSRGSSIIPTRGNISTISGRPPLVASSSTSNSTEHPARPAPALQRVRPSHSSSDHEPVAGPSKPTQSAAELTAPTSSTQNDAPPQDTSNGTSEDPIPDKPKSRPRPRPKSGLKGKSKATEAEVGDLVEGDPQQERRTRPQRTPAKRKRASGTEENDDDANQLSAPEPADDNDEAPVEEPQGVKKKRQRKASTRKRKAKASDVMPDAGEEVEDDEIAERTHAPPRRFQRRQKKLTAFDLVPEDQIPVDEEGQPMIVDPDAITMAELCMDLGVGRPSSRTEESVGKSLEWKSRQRILRQQARERQKAKYSIVAGRVDGAGGDGEPGATADGNVEDAENGLGEEEGGEQELGAAARRLQQVETNTEATNLPPEPDPQNGGDNNHDLSSLRTNRHAVQVRLDENGDIVMDELSLTVDRYEAARAEAPEDSYELVEEAERDRFVNSLTWSKKLTGSRWTKEETDLFYYYHGMWGTDFEMIAHLMPGRTRREIRNKYNTESKKNPTRLDQAFAKKIPIDLDELSKATGLDFSGPVPEYGPPAASLDKDGDANAEKDNSQLQVSAPPDFDDDDADLPDLATVGFGRRSTNEVDESGRAGSPISATSGVSSAGGKKGKASKVKHGKQGKKGKKRGQVLADDEEVIGTVEGF